MFLQMVDEPFPLTTASICATAWCLKGEGYIIMHVLPFHHPPPLPIPKLEAPHYSQYHADYQIKRVSKEGVWLRAVVQLPPAP